MIPDQLESSSGEGFLSSVNSFINVGLGYLIRFDYLRFYLTQGLIAGSGIGLFQYSTSERSYYGVGQSSKNVWFGQIGYRFDDWRLYTSFLGNIHFFEMENNVTLRSESSESFLGAEWQL